MYSKDEIVGIKESVIAKLMDGKASVNEMKKEIALIQTPAADVLLLSAAAFIKHFDRFMNCNVHVIPEATTDHQAP